MSKKNYNAYTEEEVHAELCYAECCLMRGIITFIQDDNLMNIVKGGLRFRKSLRCYKECYDILSHRTWANESLKRNFESGVHMGNGAFNLVISCLPKRILKLVEFAGFSGKREVGFQKLEQACKMSETVRGPLSSLFILAFHTLISYYFGRGCSNLAQAEEVLKPWLSRYPDSGVTRYFVARIENIKGNPRKCIQLIEESLKLPMEWKNVFHVGYFELGWTHALLGEWRNALKYADIMLRENNWSKCTFSYIKAALLLSCDDITDAEKKEVATLLQSLPGLKRRFSGKSNPMEKLFCRKADRYFSQGNSLVLPIYELLYVGNSYINMKNKAEYLQPILAKVEAAHNALKGQKDGPNVADNYNLTVFLKGICLSNLGKTAEAEACFKEVVSNQKKIKTDIYLPVCSNMEMAFIAMDSGNYSQATNLLKTAKKEKTFWPEFRIHQAREEIKSITKK